MISGMPQKTIVPDQHHCDVNVDQPIGGWSGGTKKRDQEAEQHAGERYLPRSTLRKFASSLGTLSAGPASAQAKPDGLHTSACRRSGTVQRRRQQKKHDRDGLAAEVNRGHV
jgi:hypothetical protein